MRMTRLPKPAATQYDAGIGRSLRVQRLSMAESVLAPVTPPPPPRERSWPSPGRGKPSVRGGVGVTDLGGDPAAVGHVEAVVTRPGPDVRRAGSAGGTASAATAARGPTGVADVRRDGVAQLGCVLRAQVDLVLLAVEGEADRLLGLAAVDVVDQDDVHLLRHGSLISCEIAP